MNPRVCGAKLNLPPMKAFRAPGFVEGTWSLECALDKLAAELGVDPLELRKRNHAETDPMNGTPFSSKELLECYRRAEPHWERRHEVRARSDETWKRGMGLASQIWYGGGGPPSYAWVRLGSDGRANVVTAITALILFAVATAGVKGFALMLLIGTAISLLTAVAATRALLHLLSGFRWFDNPRFMGAHGQQTAKWLQIDFMRRSYWWLALSGVVILAGAVSLGVRGLNLGIDFKGGTLVYVRFASAPPIDQIRKGLDDAGVHNSVETP